MTELENMEKTIPCKWWKLVHYRTNPKYNGTYIITAYECTKPIMCEHNVIDSKLGGCKYKGYPPSEET